MIRIWPAWGFGIGICVGFSAEAGPLPPSTAMAIMVSASTGLVMRLS